MIYRALAVSTSPTWVDRDCVERRVFIEAENRDGARLGIREVLAKLWDVDADSIEFWNLESEFELNHGAFVENVAGDHRLFVAGWADGKPSFDDGTYGHPLFLLSTQLDRMMSAYLTLPRNAQKG
ncbi:hypothetical protein [Pseudomonas hormoni]